MSVFIPVLSLSLGPAARVESLSDFLESLGYARAIFKVSWVQLYDFFHLFLSHTMIKAFQLLDANVSLLFVTLCYTLRADITKVLSDCHYLRAVLNKVVFGCVFPYRRWVGLRR